MATAPVSLVGPAVFVLGTIGLAPLLVFGVSELVAPDNAGPAVETEAPTGGLGELHAASRRAPRPNEPLTEVEPTAGAYAPASPFLLMTVRRAETQPYDSSASTPAASSPGELPAPDAASAPTPGLPGPQPTPCGITACAPGDTCCSPTCGLCAKPGEDCSGQSCGAPTYPTSVQCGANTCDVGEACCNASCGICKAPGATCSQELCENGPTLPFSQACGMNTCSVGSVCCDPTCGLCAPVAECARSHC